MSEERWSDAKDAEYCGLDEYSTREALMDSIAGTLPRYEEVLDCAIRFLRRQQHEEEEDVLSLLSIEAKIECLESLIQTQSNDIPTSHRLDYLGRFDEDFQRYRNVERIRNQVLGHFLVNPQATWRRELADLRDWLLTAARDFDELMGCEHEGYVSTFDAQPESLAEAAK